jgi:hypothetical protein
LQSSQIKLNGRVLKLEANDSLPSMEGIVARAGAVRLPPATITFLTLLDAANKACGAQ